MQLWFDYDLTWIKKSQFYGVFKALKYSYIFGSL